MKTIILSCLVASFFLSPIHFAEAQQQGKIPKIGWLSPSSAASTTRIDLLLPELRKLGYLEGKNIVIESRYAEDKLDRLPVLADELVRLKVDVLVASGGNAAGALKNSTSTIPIVFFGAVAEPVATGLVESLARPGGNVTGFTSISEDLIGKRLELLKETIPKLAHVAVLWDPKNPSGARLWKESQMSARGLGLQLHSMEVSSSEKYEGAFKEATKARHAAMAVTQHALASSNLKRIVDLATKNRLPAIYYRRDFVEGGGLMSYGADEVEPFRRAASMIDKILKGARPTDLPVLTILDFGYFGQEPSTSCFRNESRY